MNKIRVMVIFGGKSNEHEVSNMSAAAVIDAINKDKYEIIKIGIDKLGRWFTTDADSNSIKNGDWIKEKNNEEIYINFSNNLGIYTNGNDKKIIFDCILPILHGYMGEDGKLQGLLDILESRYLGSNTMASAISMDKAMTKRIVSTLEDIKQARYIEVDKYSYHLDKNKVLAYIKEFANTAYPIFVKPANSGSSVGISKVDRENDIEKALEVAFDIDNNILIEEGIQGREIEIAILGNNELETTLVGEIISSNKEMYDYEAKYLSNQSVIEILQNIDEGIVTKIREDALKIYKTLRCRGLSRVDFFLTDEGEVIFNEINTMPGFTKHSMYPQLWRAMGVSFEALVEKMIKLAMEEV